MHQDLHNLLPIIRQFWNNKNKTEFLFQNASPDKIGGVQKTYQAIWKSMKLVIMNFNAAQEVFPRYLQQTRKL